MNKIISLAMAGLAAASVSHAALADGGAKFLGNITTSSQIRSDMGTYWNQITNENGCKWGSIHSTDANGNSVFNFNGFDSCENGYKWAKAEPGRTFKFHALIWGSQKPNFLCTKKNPGITKEKTLKYITEWFDAVAAKFPDLEYIDVVNEAIWSGDPVNGNYHSGYSKPAQGAEGISTDDPECGGTYIVQALGGDDVDAQGKHHYNFVKKAFEMAVKKMKRKNPSTGQMEKITPVTKEKGEEILTAHNIKLENDILYDAAYVYNMGKADYWGSSIEDDVHLARYVKDVLDDPDGSDELPFRFWLQKMVALGKPVDWEEMI